MHKTVRPETKPGYSISCHDIPDAFVNDKLVIKQYFQKYGKVVRIVLRPKRKACLVEFSNEASAQAAVIVGGNFEGKKFKITWTKQKGSETKAKKPATKKREWAEDSDILDELEAMKSAFSMDNLYSPNTRGKEPTPQSALLQKKPRLKKTSLKTSTPVKLVTSKVNKIMRESKLETKSSPKQEIQPIINTEQASELLKILTKRGETSEDKYRILDARDKLIRLKMVKQSNLSKVGKTVGTCPDMCPEKERLMREAQHQVALYEQLGENRGSGMNHTIAVKQYSRSSADQESPLAHELRPVDVLETTMGYLMHRIADLCDSPDVNLAEWYHFMWDRTRGIRKDITQQELCSQGSVRLVEQCARFHIHCSARLVAEDASVFDQKINTENLTKCLQTLKYMYHDLAVKGEKCPNEAEFRGYVVLLNLNDGNFMWELQELNLEIQESPQVKFALQVYSALDKNNYVRFFKLVKSTTYLNACILLRYFNQVRLHALRRILKSFSPRQPYKTYPIYELTSILAFEDESSTIEFLEYYGLSVSSDGTDVLLDRKMFSSPDLPFQNDRAINVVETKRNSSIGEVICGGPLPPRDFEKIIPYNSFDQYGYLKNSEIPSEWRSKCRDLSFEQEISLSDTSTENEIYSPSPEIGEKPTPAFTFCLPKKPEVSFDGNLKLPSPKTNFSFTNPQNIQPKVGTLPFGTNNQNVGPSSFSFTNPPKSMPDIEATPTTTFSFTKPNSQPEMKSAETKPSSLFESKSFDTPDYGNDKIFDAFFGSPVKENPPQTFGSTEPGFSFKQQMSVIHKSPNESLASSQLPSITFGQKMEIFDPNRTSSEPDLNQKPSFTFGNQQPNLEPQKTRGSIVSGTSNNFNFGSKIDEKPSFGQGTTVSEGSKFGTTSTSLNFGSKGPDNTDFRSEIPQTTNFSINTAPNVNFGGVSVQTSNLGFNSSQNLNLGSNTWQNPNFGSKSSQNVNFGSNVPISKISESVSQQPTSANFDLEIPKISNFTSTTIPANQFSFKAPPNVTEQSSEILTNIKFGIKEPGKIVFDTINFSSNTTQSTTVSTKEPQSNNFDKTKVPEFNFGSKPTDITSKSNIQPQVSIHQKFDLPKSTSTKADTNSASTAISFSETKITSNPKIDFNPKTFASKTPEIETSTSKPTIKPNEGTVKEVKKILENVLSKVDKHVEKDRKLRAISNKIRKRKMINYVQKWKKNALISKLKREEFYDNSVWVSTKSVNEEAKNLYMESQNLNLSDKKRYLGGKVDDILPKMPESEVERLNIYRTVWKILHEKLVAMHQPSLSIFWKIGISIFRNGSYASKMWERTVYSLLNLTDKKSVVHCQNGNQLEKGGDFEIGSLVYSLQKIENSPQNDLNGLLFLLDSTELNTFFQNAPKLIGDSPFPVLILIFNSNIIQDKGTLIDNINLRNATNYEIILVEKGLTIPLITASLQWLAHNLPPSPSVEMDSLESLLNKTLGEEFWCRLSTNSHLNKRLQILLRHPNVTINLYNEALTLLKGKLFDEEIKFPEFPKEFKTYLYLSFIKLPATYKYFTETWKDDLEKAKTVIDTLFLPHFDEKWPQTGLRETIESLERYCQKCEVSVKTFNSLVKYIASFIDFEERTSKNITLISWSEIVRLIINEKILNLKQNRDLLIVYNVEPIKEFCETPWWYRTEEILTKIKTVTDDSFEIEVDQCLEETINETFDNIDFNQTLNDVTLFIEKEEAKIDDNVKKEYNELNAMMADLRESLDIQDKIMKRFKELTDNALNDTLFSESFFDE